MESQSIVSYPPPAPVILDLSSWWSRVESQQAGFVCLLCCLTQTRASRKSDEAPPQCSVSDRRWIAKRDSWFWVGPIVFNPLSSSPWWNKQVSLGNTEVKGQDQLHKRSERDTQPKDEALCPGSGRWVIVFGLQCQGCTTGSIPFHFHYCQYGKTGSKMWWMNSVWTNMQTWHANGNHGDIPCLKWSLQEEQHRTPQLNWKHSSFELK